jgi:bifunctional UDP-N-acetylglucosamine pyrophosphorylase / glucosamine-1-phosphate N-acetyltransferase
MEETNERGIVAIIMAGGLGSRMNSDTPKVLHKIYKIPMIVHILIKLQEFKKIRDLKQIFIIVGKYKDEIKSTIEKYIKIPYITYVDQYDPKGTGHAIQCCSNELLNYKDSDAIILSGDVPLFSTISMNHLVSNLNKARIVTTEIENPAGYGRIITNNNIFERIKENNDCTIDELDIKKVNCGIYAFNVEVLLKWISEIKNNNSKGEYYLTDIVELIKNGENTEIDILEISTEKQYEIMGVNTPEQLKNLEEKFIKSLSK